MQYIYQFVNFLYLFETYNSVFDWQHIQKMRRIAITMRL